jgi:hypothetical protein
VSNEIEIGSIFCYPPDKDIKGASYHTEKDHFYIIQWIEDKKYCDEIFKVCGCMKTAFWGDNVLWGQSTYEIDANELLKLDYLGNIKDYLKTLKELQDEKTTR